LECLESDLAALLHEDIHNIQEAKRVKDVGGSMPRIYAALDNKQEEY
jgi:hypothetical protein